VLKAFGVHHQLQPLLLGFFEPLGPRGAELAERVVGFVEGVQVGLLGSLGLAMLLYTAVSLTRKVEVACNTLWHVRRERSLTQRLTGYLGVILVGPLLVVTAMGITAALLSSAVVQDLLAVEPLGTLYRLVAQLVPYLLVVAAFTFIYVVIPNTRVRPGPAFAGGLAAGVLWEAAGWTFGSFAVGSARYTVVYSSFAIGVVFLVWIFLSWLILLLGARLAFYVQHPESLRDPSADARLSPRLAERLALLVMARVARTYLAGEGPAPDTEGLARELGVPLELLEPVTADLQGAGLLVAAGRDAGSEAGWGFLPGRSPERLPLSAVVGAVRTAGGHEAFAPVRLPADPGVDRFYDAMEGGVEAALRGATAADLAEGGEPPAGE
ncbi:MAG TPA: YihY/virulence factor BrkB family protein, partial [Gammaproteobacteria bacterium]|nr:YihY/virulence factor BrkB family protein [Gammaproteobacteria bacterium]